LSRFVTLLALLFFILASPSVAGPKRVLRAVGMFLALLLLAGCSAQKPVPVPQPQQVIDCSHTDSPHCEAVQEKP
jgi:hypothetical protein